jgi:hypothetical protein
VSVGLAAQQIRLDGEYSRDRGEPLLGNPISRTFNNIIPNVNANYEFKNNMSIGGSYSYTVTEPELQQLQPIPNVNNPAFQYVGNPNLAPETSHSINFDIGYWNPANFSNFNIWTEYSIFDSKIVESQSTTFTGELVRVTARPENVEGGYHFGTGAWSSLPIIKTKLSFNLSGNINFDKSPVFVDAQETTTNARNYNIRAGLTATPNQKLILGLNSNLGFNHTTYEINQTLTQDFQNHSIDASIKWQVINKTFLESNLNYSRYTNDRLNFNREVSLWNASLRRLVGKNNRVEIRLSAFDILNQRVNIVQNASLNFVNRSVAPTLARYFMLGVSYNVRGYENKIKKNDWW